MTNIEHLVENGINATLRGCFKEVMSQEHNKMMLEMEKNKISESTLWEIVQYIVYTKDGVGKKEIRAKAIDEFVEALLNYQPQDEDYKSFSDVCYEVAEKLKGGAE